MQLIYYSGAPPQLVLLECSIRLYNHHIARRAATIAAEVQLLRWVLSAGYMAP